MSELKFSKEAISGHLGHFAEEMHNAVAAAHGWKLYNLECQAPTRASINEPLVPCGYVIPAHPVHKNASIEAEKVVRLCPKCNVRGNWKHTEHQPKPKQKPVESIAMKPNAKPKPKARN